MPPCGSPLRTTTNGFPLAAGEDIEVDMVTEHLYAVVATGTTSIFILRRGD